MVGAREAELELIGAARAVVWFMTLASVGEGERIKLSHLLLKTALERLDRARGD